MSEKETPPSRMIDERIKELGDWRGKMLAHVRKLVKQAVPDVVEEWKWRGVPVWYRDGIICTGETYKSVVKLTFAKGAALEDPTGLFNSSLEGNVRRAIDIPEDAKIDDEALKALIRAAVALNSAEPAKATKAAKATIALKPTKAAKETKPAKVARSSKAARANKTSTKSAKSPKR